MNFDSPATFQFLANAVLASHVGIVLFIIGGLVLTLIGGARGWKWVRNFYFRAAHTLGIIYIAMEAWLGIICPLTTLEMYLRERAGQTVYDGDFIAFWLRKFLFFEAPPWAFIVAYSAFGLLVILAWVLVRPNLPWRRGAGPVPS